MIHSKLVLTDGETVLPSSVFTAKRFRMDEFLSKYESDSDEDLYVTGFGTAEMGENPNLDYDCIDKDKTILWTLTYYTQPKSTATGDGYDTFAAFYNDSRHILRVSSCAVPKYKDTTEVVEAFKQHIKAKGDKTTSFKLWWYNLLLKWSYLIQKYLKAKSYDFEKNLREEEHRLHGNLYKTLGDTSRSTRFGEYGLAKSGERFYAPSQFPAAKLKEFSETK